MTFHSFGIYLPIRKHQPLTSELQNDIFWASRIEGEKNMGMKMNEHLHRMKAPCSHMYGSPTSVKMCWLQTLKRHFIWHHLKLQQHVAKVPTVNPSKVTSTSKSPTTNKQKSTSPTTFTKWIQGTALIRSSLRSCVQRCSAHWLVIWSLTSLAKGLNLAKVPRSMGSW